MSQREPAKEVRLFGLLDYLLRRFSAFNRKFRKREIRLTIKQSIVEFFLGALADAGAAGIWIYAGLRALDGSVSVGDVVLFTTAVTTCKTTLVFLFQQGGQFYKQTLFLGNLFALLDLDPRAVPGSLSPPAATGIAAAKRWGDRRAPLAVEHGIEFRGVSFRYPGTDTDGLHDVSFILASRCHRGGAQGRRA